MQIANYNDIKVLQEFTVFFYLADGQAMEFKPNAEIKHLWNYINKTHNIYSLHIFTVFLLHVSMFLYSTIIGEKLCALCCVIVGGFDQRSNANIVHLVGAIIEVLIRWEFAEWNASKRQQVTRKLKESTLLLTSSCMQLLFVSLLNNEFCHIFEWFISYKGVLIRS
jgi:hypothetical protein